MERDEIRKITDAATPGPWGLTREDDSVRTDHTPENNYCSEHICSMDHYRDERQAEKQPNASFIAMSRTVIPQLLDELDEKDRDKAELEEALGRLCVSATRVYGIRITSLEDPETMKIRDEVVTTPEIENLKFVLSEITSLNKKAFQTHKRDGK